MSRNSGSADCMASQAVAERSLILGLAHTDSGSDFIQESRIELLC